MNAYNGICSPCGNYLGTPSTYTSTWSHGQCVNCGRMEPVTELRDFGYPLVSKNAIVYAAKWEKLIAEKFEANNLNLIQTIIRKIKTGMVTL